MTVIDIPYPTKCNECRCYNIAYGVCSIGFRKVDETKKPKWCPIKCDFDKIRAEIAENGNSDINTQTVLSIIDRYREDEPDETDN